MKRVGHPQARLLGDGAKDGFESRPVNLKTKGVDAMVKRYDLLRMPDGAELTESTDGEYVRFSDYDALVNLWPFVEELTSGELKVLRKIARLALETQTRHTESEHDFLDSLMCLDTEVNSYFEEYDSQTKIPYESTGPLKTKLGKVTITEF